MSFVETKDLRMYYELDGPTSAPALVLSNSLGTNLSLWDPQLPVFAQNFRLLRYDSRGHGRTSAPQGAYSIEMLARDLLQLLDALNLQRINFCGLSIGGMTGMWLAVNAPQRLQKLILANTAPKIGKLETWNDRINAVRKGGTNAVAQQVVERWFTPEFRANHPDQIAKTRRMIETTSTDGYVGSCAAVRDFDFWQNVGAIRTQTLVIAGTHDQSVPPSDAQKLAKQIKGARYIEFRAAHISNVEAATRFTDEVSAFLRT
ncbi:MAG TPA: 3-oxoadipate enol-lactonase [Candidatus Acidoferrum sp.]|jgi:3-oxoadipate enol-lactonase|nr:3-oxoadipate enol-lactonase [Candidatus Acidoferrum sp.]